MSEVRFLRDRIEQLEELLGIDRSTNDRIRDALKLEPLHAQIVGMLTLRSILISRCRH